MSFLVTSIDPPSAVTTGETAELEIILTANPAPSAGQYQEYIAKLTIGGEDIRIRGCEWSRQRDSIGVDCGFTLADINDRALITPTSSLTFQIGIKSGGVTTWKQIASLQRLSERSFDVVNDTFTFKSISGVAEKLNKAPGRPFMMYDPDRVPFDSTKIEKLYDAEGRIYEVEEIIVPGLTLYDVFEEVFVNRCGFSSYWTDIEDYPVPQLAVAVNETFLGALNPLIEPFCAPGEEGPMLVEVDGELKIYDTSRSKPVGFPHPRDMTVWGCSGFSLTSEFSDVEAVRMVFTVPDTWDYVTNRIVVTNLPTGDNLFTLHVENIFELRSYFQPDLIMDERVQFVWDYVSTLLGTMVSQEIVSNTFDRYGRETLSHIRRWARVPDGVTLGVAIPVNPDEEEFQATEYAPHPSKLGRQYQRSVTRNFSGSISSNFDNPYLGEAFRQPLRLAHWGGNADVGVDIEQGFTRTFMEHVTPHRNGQVTRQVIDYDHVRDLPVVQKREPAVGDVSLNGNNSRSRDILVTLDGAEYTGSGRVIDMYTGPIPPHMALELVRRRMAKMLTAPQKVALNIIGVDPDVEIGEEFSSSDKLDQIEGDFVCVGFSGQGVNLGTENAEWSMSVEGSEI